MKKLTQNPYAAIVAGLILLALIVRFAYQLNMLVGGISLLGLLIGWKSPETLRPLFKDKTSKANICWSFGGLFVLTAMLNAVLEPKSPKPVSPTPVTTAGIPENGMAIQPQPTTINPRVVASTKPKPSVKPKPAVKLSAQETVQALMEKQFGKRLRDVKVTSVGKGRYSVKVEFDNSLRLTLVATKDYMEGDMQDAYKAIFTSGLKVVEAELEAYGEGTDKFGKRFRSPAYHTALDGEVAEQIDWSNYRAARWDELWRVLFLHPNYEKKSSSLFETVELKAKAGWNESGIQLLNDNAFDWEEVKVYVNPTFGLSGGYSASLGTLRVGEQRFIPYGELATNKGERFDPVSTKILRIKVACQTPEGAAMGELKAD